MSNNIVEFYELLGFEEVDIDEGQLALGIELSADGAYGLLTDTEGNMPTTQNREIIFALYSPEDAFLWSASFKNSAVFKDIWTSAATGEDKLAAIKNYREANERF